MVINQGLFATEQGKTVIQAGIQQASTPLAVDGTIFVKTNTDGTSVIGLLIPVKTYGVKYVSMINDTTVVTLKIGANAWANVYSGVNETTPGGNFTTMLNQTAGTDADAPFLNCTLYIQNSNGDQALDSSEKGYIVISLSDVDAALVRAQINVEIRLEKTAPLTIQFTIPESMPKDAWVNV